MAAVCRSNRHTFCTPCRNGSFEVFFYPANPVFGVVTVVDCGSLEDLLYICQFLLVYRVAFPKKTIRCFSNETCRETKSL